MALPTLMLLLPLLMQMTKAGMVMLQNTKAQKYTYSLRIPANIKGKVLENNLTGLVMIVDNREAYFRMIGTFNAYNLLAVVCVCSQSN